MNESWKDQRIADLEAENNILRQENAELKKENAELKARVKHLEEQLADLAEKYSVLQKMLFGASTEKSKALGLAQKKTAKKAKRKKSKTR